MSRYKDIDLCTKIIKKEFSLIKSSGVSMYQKGRRDGLVLANAILRYDKRVPNADVVEVVRCKDCKYYQDRYIELPDCSKRPYKKGESSVPLSVGINVGSYCTRIDYAIVHGYRHGEPSVDETRLWTKPDGFCSYGERKDEE